MVTCPSCRRELTGDFAFCPYCAAPLSEQQPAVRHEERKVVSVVFCDLVGFTAASEHVDPEDVQARLRPYHEHVRQVIESYGGIVEKFVGDAVMAVFGAPIAHEDDAERAVRAGLRILDAIKDLNTADEKLQLQVRVGINTGETVVDLSAHPEHGEGFVTGDVVNTASRLQGFAPVNGVLVGETTYRATRDAIGYHEAPPVHAKGKAEPIRVWQAVETASRPVSDIHDRALTLLVGRDLELELLHSILARVRREHSSQLVTLVGVPGIGKSRLVHELLKVVEGAAEPVSWRQGRCLPYGKGVKYWALGEIVKAEVGVLESDSSDEVEGKLHRAVTGLVSEASEARWLEAELRVLVGLAPDGLHAEGGETTTAAWRRFLEAVAERGPAVFVFEDLHWADDGLLDFVDDLVEWLSGVSLMVVGTARPELLERRQTWGGGKANATTISLQPLGEDEMVRLISALREQPSQNEVENRTLLERTGGNPLFAEQYVRMVKERGTAGELPESVQGVIASRLDALRRPEKELLQEASVHGKVFWLGAVASGIRQNASDVSPLLRTLERKDFIRRERQSAVVGDTQYSFQHVLLRDVAYHQIPRRGRAEKHRRAGEWIEALGRPDDHAEVVAHHYETALDLARAAGTDADPSLVQRVRESLRAAGRRAMGLSAHGSAAEFFGRALAHCPRDDPTRPRLLLELARALRPIGGSGLEPATEALAAFRAAEDAEGTAEAATLAARFSWGSGDRSATDRYMAIALDAVADRPWSRARAEALTTQSGFHMLAGRFDASIRVGAEALPLVEALGMEDERSRLRSRLHIVVGCARCCVGEPEGLNEIETEIAVAQAAGAFEMAALGYMNLSSELNFFGRLAESRRAWHRHNELSERYGFTRHLRTGRAEAVAWAFLDGRWDDAVRVANELIAAADAGDRDYSDPAVLAVRASIWLGRGDAAGADKDSRRAAELARASDAQAQSQAFCVRAAVAFAGGSREEAGELASELTAIGPVLLPALCSPFPTLAEVAWLFRDLGRENEFSMVLDATPIPSPWVDAARAITGGDLVRAADIIDGVGHTASAAYARLRAADSLATEGRAREAGVQRARADSFYRKVGAARYVRNSEC